MFWLVGILHWTKVCSPEKIERRTNMGDMDKRSFESTLEKGGKKVNVHSRKKHSHCIRNMFLNYDKKQWGHKKSILGNMALHKTPRQSKGGSLHTKFGANKAQWRLKRWTTYYRGAIIQVHPDVHLRPCIKRWHHDVTGDYRGYRFQWVLSFLLYF